MFMNCLTTNVTSVSQLSSQGPETILEEAAERPYEPEVGGGGARLEQTISPEHHGTTALMNLTAAVVVCLQTVKKDSQHSGPHLERSSH